MLNSLRMLLSITAVGVLYAQEVPRTVLQMTEVEREQVRRLQAEIEVARLSREVIRLRACIRAEISERECSDYAFDISTDTVILRHVAPAHVSAGEKK